MSHQTFIALFALIGIMPLCAMQPTKGSCAPAAALSAGQQIRLQTLQRDIDDVKAIATQSAQKQIKQVLQHTENIDAMVDAMPGLQFQATAFKKSSQPKAQEQSYTGATLSAVYTYSGARWAVGRAASLLGAGAATSHQKQ